MGQAVDGDHAVGGGDCQKTQSGQERGLQGQRGFRNLFKKSHVVSTGSHGGGTPAHLPVTAGELPASCRTPLQGPDEAAVLGQAVGQGRLRVRSAGRTENTQ